MAFFQRVISSKEHLDVTNRNLQICQSPCVIPMLYHAMYHTCRYWYNLSVAKGKCMPCLSYSALPPMSPALSNLNMLHAWHYVLIVHTPPPPAAHTHTFTLHHPAKQGSFSCHPQFGGGGRGGCQRVDSTRAESCWSCLSSYRVGQHILTYCTCMSMVESWWWIFVC